MHALTACAKTADMSRAYRNFSPPSLPFSVRVRYGTPLSANLHSRSQGLCLACAHTHKHTCAFAVTEVTLATARETAIFHGSQISLGTGVSRSESRSPAFQSHAAQSLK
uniref:Uncharacterized protein n=1 Tax=Schistocephalus solidus TaxID=70667 RepID=A0A0X3NYM1_SCHSO